MLYWRRSRLEKIIHVPGILSLELESLYEKELTYASQGTS
jgi:hypothetical protein